MTYEIASSSFLVLAITTLRGGTTKPACIGQAVLTLDLTVER